jgi:biotin operon repressor
MNGVMVMEESRPVGAGATIEMLGRGLSVVDVLLTLARVRQPISLEWLHKYNIEYSRRALWWALARLEGAGYVIRVGREYSIAPSVFASPNMFLPPTRPGIAEVDILLLVLSGVKRPKPFFSKLYGSGKLVEYIYRTAVRRLIRLGYLERDRGRWYHPGKRTMALLTASIIIYERDNSNISNR